MRPSRPLAQRLASAAVAAVTGAVLVGCSGDSGSGGADGAAASGSSSASEDLEAPADPVAALQDAVGATVDARVFTVDGDLDLQVAGQQLRLATAGSVDYDATVADVELSIESDGQTSEAGILADGEDLWVRAEGEGIPAFPGGATWLQGEASRLAASSTFEPSGLVGAVLVLRGASEVEVLGSEEGEDGAVLRYATTFTYDDALAAVSGAEEETLQSAFSLTGDASSVDLDVEVAVGEDGVLREMDLELAETDVPASGGYQISLTDVGGEVTAPEPPDPADVATGPEAEALLDQVIV